jgi:dTDP-glucose pyrophosphorylase
MSPSLSEDLDRWKTAVLSKSAIVEEAISVLDQAKLQIALITDENGLLIGTITDGDIRRGLLRGIGMNNLALELAHKDPLVVLPGIGRDAILQIMKANGLNHIPIIDDNRNLIGLHTLKMILSPLPRLNPFVIMAGGRGTRLHPYTENCPKPLLLVAGKPMLEHIIERAKNEGFHHFFIAINYLGEMIEEYFGDGSRWQVKIDYLREKLPLGTAGALCLLDLKSSIPIIVTNGDVLTDVSYGELLDFHGQHNSVATMAVRPYEWQHPYGVVQIDGVSIIGFEEKPISLSYINAGLYALGSTALEMLEINMYCDMPTLFSKIKAQGLRIIAYPMHEPWLDIGRPIDFEAAQKVKIKDKL